VGFWLHHLPFGSYHDLPVELKYYDHDGSNYGCYFGMGEPPLQIDEVVFL
jgi:hypothetical protein